ncbi:MAG: hypothetical protein HOI59_08505 [Nitrospina sp.]|jgi:hypothetical protein|nr:hypothetical protein [Nitrospina sp.]MBT3415176.1 hypothetical protein [Nitrospina sp.]MBT3855285.1 hypothetical protein [Nitrospina sp.]MBT4105746.1 hypothetical protein [Nitrospina sp.]MBT4389673.1 hypothetical protein [Nitrospina sp.]
MPCFLTPLLFVIALCIGLTPSTSWAEEKRTYVQPLNEVFQTEMVYPQEKGEVQLQLSPKFSEGDKRDLIQVPFAIEYGITDFWQVEAAWYAHVNRNPAGGVTTRGVGDLEVETKYSFMNIAGSNFHAAVGLEIKFSTGDINKELTEGFNEYEPFLALAKDFPEWNHSQVFTEIRIGFLERTQNHADQSEDEAEANDFHLHVGFFIPVGLARLTTELVWITNEWHNQGDENKLFLTPGLVWDLPGTWEWGIGVPIGLNDKSDNYRIITHLIYEFDVF